jgi:hypothetical protein
LHRQAPIIARQAAIVRMPAAAYAASSSLLVLEQAGTSFIEAT